MPEIAQTKADIEQAVASLMKNNEVCHELINCAIIYLYFIFPF